MSEWMNENKRICAFSSLIFILSSGQLVAIHFPPCVYNSLEAWWAICPFNYQHGHHLNPGQTRFFNMTAMLRV